VVTNAGILEELAGEVMVGHWRHILCWRGQRPDRLVLGAPGEQSTKKLDHLPQIAFTLSRPKFSGRSFLLWAKTLGGNLFGDEKMLR
jgi:hypothetical protein